jgi:multidrug efflux system membrane fusion protein
VVTATTVNVTALVEGQLTAVAAVEGKTVKAGQVLGTIESPQLQWRLDRTLSQLSEDRALHAKAAISADEAAVAQAQRLVADTQVRAPISGVAGFRKVDPGNFVHAGETLLVITQQQPIAVVFTIPEDVLPRVKALVGRGANPLVEVFNRTFTARLATGRLAAIDNEIDEESGTVKLKASVGNMDGALFPNQFVNVRMRLTNPDHGRSPSEPGFQKR